MKKELLLMSVLLGIGAFFLKTPAYGTEIIVPVNGGDAQKSITYQMNNGTVLRIKGEPDNVHLLITQPGMQPVSIELPDEISHVRSITPVADGQVVLIGDFGELSSVVLVNVPQYRITDNFWGFKPSLSPDGRFIVFIKSYPPHLVSGVSDFVMVYDIADGPNGNRSVGSNVDKLVDVGTAVYPPGIKTASPNAGLPEVDINTVTSGFFWAPNSSAFVFSTEHELTNSQTPTKNSNSAVKTEVDLVLVDMSSPGVPQKAYFLLMSVRTARPA